MAEPVFMHKVNVDPRSMVPPGNAGYDGGYAGQQPPQGYSMQQPGMQAYAPPGYANQQGMPPGYPMPQGMQAPPPGYAGQPPGQAAPTQGYPYPQQQAFMPPGYAPNGAMPQFGNPAFGFNPYVPGGVVYPMGQIPPEFAAQAAFGAFSQGLPASMYDGIARMMGIPPRNQQDSSDPRNQVKRGAWETGLFNCCDFWIPNGCMACFCPCVSLAQISTRLGNRRYQASIIQFALMWIFPLFARLMPEIMIRSMGGGGFMEMPFVANIVLLFPFIVTATIVSRIRAMIRIRFQIPGSCCGDCAAGCCLWPCAIAQIATHVKSYTPGSCSFDAPDILPPFV